MVRSLSNEQINLIPPGFANNLIWNYGHMVVTQQMIVYGLSGLPLYVDREPIAAYRRGSKPEQNVSRVAVDRLVDLHAETISLLEKDLNRHDLFQNFQEHTTVFGTTMTDHREGVIFNNIHEGYHLGIMQAIRKFV